VREMQFSVHVHIPSIVNKTFNIAFLYLSCGLLEKLAVDLYFIKDFQYSMPQINSFCDGQDYDNHILIIIKRNELLRLLELILLHLCTNNRT